MEPFFNPTKSVVLLHLQSKLPPKHTIKISALSFPKTCLGIIIINMHYSKNAEQWDYYAEPSVSNIYLKSKGNLINH